MAELVDAPDSKSGSFGSEGSTPSPGTIHLEVKSAHSMAAEIISEVAKNIFRPESNPGERNYISQRGCLTRALK